MGAGEGGQFVPASGAITATHAATIEAVEAAMLAGQVGALAACGALPEGRCLRLGNIAAALTHARFGRKLNHVVGFGLGDGDMVRQLAEIELAYAGIGCVVEIDLCPFADSATLGLLADRGYAVNAFANSYVHDLANIAPPLDGIQIRDAARAEADPFVQASIDGFLAQPSSRSAELSRLLALSALHRTDTMVQIAEIDGEIAGTSALSILDVGPICGAYLHLASTLPRHRNRGVQAALLRARLSQAAEAGAAFAMVQARPQSASARNAERAGFSLAYTKPTFARQSASPSGAIR